MRKFQEVAEVGKNGLAEFAFGRLLAQTEKLQHIVVLERQQLAGLGVVGQGVFRITRSPWRCSFDT